MVPKVAVIGGGIAGIQASLDLAEMGIDSITPGVEDAAILSLFWTLKVDFVQGDFLQAPDKDLSYDFSSM